MNSINQCGQNKIYKNPHLFILSRPLSFGHLKGLTNVLFVAWLLYLSMFILISKFILRKKEF